ncbi:lytic transglycosylase domain-containing protein [Bradyrhizobium sp. 180]|uniref:lytic transglycosylase domain-containing protein n=1 Tax=unclassified Bradyrhizobium TaxID=2631580 RepID=UPI001FFB7A83|nr:MULTISPECIES: lytic transglycosylase domain-containing protein [unclassified Bradyrhizobium]MCK1422828.1 lytic transglycosylase domain-containing protein [Bradyrhizobium sp. CW12]MCK1492241.1 lytic transglycosylase domain-containing protein [Bradyrhizobium sp. 180]MCK1532572.1 lytic transglycosylase domain-containing protein [Bradyrhizobium sp. 182]MCK1598946.1 lytic transglycosylase domain-containing protein [Bradyrhizobium sp. 164]MCK1617370.1 lytic transglycosylase domain-containing prot
MRFVVAACAAFLILMCDLDPSASRQTSTFDTTVLQNNHALPLVPVVELFLASVQAIELANARAAYEEKSDPPRASETVAEGPVSPTDRFCHALREAAETSGIPVPFFARLIWQESRFKSNEVSHAGAQGVAQFMPETAAEVGLDDPFDPMKALPASAKFLRKLRDDFGNLGLAAAAYNAGPGRIQKWLAKESELPRETRDYVRIITGTRADDWTERAEALAIRIDLPREAPCEGVGSLSKARDVAWVPVNLTPSVTTIIRKGEQLAARLTANRARKRFATLLRKNTSAHGNARSMIAARAAGKSAKTRAIRFAARERTSG